MDVREILKASNNETLAKAYTSSFDFGTANSVEIRFEDAIATYGAYETPLLSRVGQTRAMSDTHKWQQVAVASPAENKQVEGIAVSALTAVSATPTVGSNYCQLVADLITVSGSASAAAANGAYGASLRDLLKFQIDVRIPKMLSDIEFSALYGVAAAGNETTAREMAGLVGTAASGGYDDGLVTAALGSNVDTNSGSAFDESALQGWLADFSSGPKPTALYVSSTMRRKISTFQNTVAMSMNISDPVAFANLTAGSVVSKYVAPWGGILDVVFAPQIVHDGSVTTNNFILAVSEPYVKMANLRGQAGNGGLVIEPVAKIADAEQALLLWEGCVEVKVPAAHGILHNFSISFS